MHVFIFSIVCQLKQHSPRFPMVKSPGHQGSTQEKRQRRRQGQEAASLRHPRGVGGVSGVSVRCIGLWRQALFNAAGVEHHRERYQNDPREGLGTWTWDLDRSRNLDLKILVEIWQWFPKRRGLLGNRNWWFHPRIVDWFLHPLRKYFVNDAWTFSAPPGHGYIAFWSFWVVWQWTSAMFHQGKASKYGPRTNSLYSSASRMVMDSLGSNLTVAECCRISRYCKSQIARAINV